MAVTAVLDGALIGTIWMPSVEATRELRVNLTREREKLKRPRAGTLGVMLKNVCKDGDFQHCRLTQETEIVLTSWRTKGVAVVKREKRIPITAFKSAMTYVEAA